MPDDGVQQAKDYAEVLGLRFAYATNGEGIVEHDFLTGKDNDLETFPTPGQEQKVSADPPDETRGSSYALKRGHKRSALPRSSASCTSSGSARPGICSTVVSYGSTG